MNGRKWFVSYRSIRVIAHEVRRSSTGHCVVENEHPFVAIQRWNARSMKDFDEGRRKPEYHILLNYREIMADEIASIEAAGIDVDDFDMMEEE